MSDYIDRARARFECKRFFNGDKKAQDDCEALLCELPAADVAPVRRGHWIPIHASELTGWNPEFAGCDPIAEYMCSRCGADAILSCNDDLVLSNYCPNCGAKMEVPNDD